MSLFSVVGSYNSTTPDRGHQEHIRISRGFHQIRDVQPHDVYAHCKYLLLPCLTWTQYAPNIIVCMIRAVLHCCRLHKYAP